MANKRYANFDFEELKLPGCYIVTPKVLNDSRGSFTKIYNNEIFSLLGLDNVWQEQYITNSNKNVIRGLHFQRPPYAHEKLVSCIHGKALDVLLDLRIGSPTFGTYTTIELSGDNRTSVYMPIGIAHGFCTPESSATLLYNVSSSYMPESDSGILWDSAGINWVIPDPLLSERDRSFQPLSTFDSPFEFKI